MSKQAQKPSRRRGAAKRKSSTVQYTVRDVPSQVDTVLRRKAVDEGRSLNQVLRDALVREAGGDTAWVVHDDLDALAGAWEEDPAIDQALADQDRVDEELWK
ncbi:MAG TPA: hypothetical protein VGR62_17460 [Candidatus Binatia bacterium]|jgi:hypothetical protein|nr:hypothetical protein [Candidatus Binatia bacterium]